MTIAEQYGIDWPEGRTLATLELQMAFNREYFKARGWEGRFTHWARAIDLIWNGPARALSKARGRSHDPRKHDPYIWNDWTEQTQQAFCESHWSTVITSGNSSWKTTGGALYGLGAWLAAPKSTNVVMTTTTLKGLRGRLWKEIMRYYQTSNAGFGHVHATDFALRWAKGSDDGGIFGVATGQTQGEVDKAIGNIVGKHNTNVIVLLDEGQATNEAILKACVSLEAGTDFFQLIIMGNIDSELSGMGQAAEPLDGWGSVTKDSGQWKTRRGICVHLNGLDSPRIEAGDEFFPGMLTKRDIDSARLEHGEDSPWFWQYRIGFPPPQGIVRTVLTAPMIRKGLAMEPAIWESTFTLGAGLDPAYEGGDRCVLQIWKCGLTIDGKTVIELVRTHILKLAASSEEPIHYQIARQAQGLCEEAKVKPEMFALDSTAEGGGVASIIKREWSSDILCVEFGGRASEERLNDTNPKKASELFDRKVSELNMRFANLVDRGMVRGLDRATANEFCLRFHKDVGYGITSVETKDEMKKRTHGRSCDLSDCACISAELFRKRGLLTSPVDVIPGKRNSWLELARQYNDVDSGYVEV